MVLVLWETLVLGASASFWADRREKPVGSSSVFCPILGTVGSLSSCFGVDRRVCSPSWEGLPLETKQRAPSPQFSDMELHEVRAAHF